MSEPIAPNIKAEVADHRPLTTNHTSAAKDVVVKGAAILMVAMILSRILGFAREKAVAHYFGAHWYTAAFVSAFNLPDLLYYLLAGGALGAAFIPVLREYLSRNDIEGGHRITNSLLNLMFLALVTTGSLAVFFAPQLVRLVAPGYDPATDPRYPLTVSLTRILLPQVVLMGLSAIFTALLQCHDHFTWPAMGWMLYNVGIIIGAVWFAGLIGGDPQQQIYGLAFGVLLGAILLVVVQFPALIAVKYRWQPVLDLRHPDVRRVGRAWLPIMLALAISQISLLSFPQWLGTFYSEGMVVNIRFAQRLILVPFSLFGVSIATALFPTISSLAFAGQMEQVRRAVARSLSSVFYFTLPSAAGLITLALPLTRLLWKSGEYTEAAALVNANLLVLFTIGLVGLCALQIINRTFFALREQATPLKVGAGIFVFNVALCYVLMQTSLDYRGIALGTSISFCVSAVILFELLRRKMGGINGREIVGSFLRCLIATILMALAILAIGTLVRQFVGTGTGLKGAGIEVIACMAVAIPVYLIATLALKVPEASRTWERIRRKLGR